MKDKITSLNGDDSSVTNLVLQVLWPGFLGAACAVGILFSLIDPNELQVVHAYLDGNAAGAYTIGFVILWFTTSLACAMTLFLCRPVKKRSQTAV